MIEIALHLLDIVQNSIMADAKNIKISVYENTSENILSLEVEDDGNGMDEETLKRAAAAKRIAEKYNLKFIPLQDKFDEKCKLAPADYWVGDGVHPANPGHELIAREWMKAFEEIK